MSIVEHLEDPAICILRLGEGQRVPAMLSRLLLPVDPSTFHVYRLPAESDVELHFHDYDEYWAFIEGHPKVDLRTPSGIHRNFDLGPGDMVVCVRGIEHTLRADHELVYYQYSSVRTGNERSGHLVRGHDA